MEKKQKRVYKIVLTGGKKKKVFGKHTKVQGMLERQGLLLILMTKNIKCIYLQVLVAVKLLDSHVYAHSSKILDGRLVPFIHLFAPAECVLHVGGLT
jgi:hypothetical protein